VFLDRSDRQVAIPLTDFRQVEGKGAALPVERIDSLLFVVDSVNTDPGASGRVLVGAVSWLP
jgi:hypothetical protein